MDRLLSITRRRPHIVDVSTPYVAGVGSYRLKWQVNFDQAETTFITCAPAGFCDVNVNRQVLHVSPSPGVRIVFDPTTYSIPDDTPFWLRLYHVTPAGVETQKTASLLVMPDLMGTGYHTIVLAGQAPNAGSLATALQIDLPRMMSDVRVNNLDAGTTMYLATDPTGYEYTLKAPSATPQFTSLDGPVSSLWVRGNGAVVNFTASMLVAHPK